VSNSVFATQFHQMKYFNRELHDSWVKRADHLDNVALLKSVVGLSWGKLFVRLKTSRGTALSEMLETEIS
jgi:hypothetical protein